MPVPFLYTSIPSPQDISSELIRTLTRKNVMICYSSQSWFTNPAHRQIAQSKSKEILKEKGRDVSAWEVIIWWGEVDGSWNNSVFCCLGFFFLVVQHFLKRNHRTWDITVCKHSCKLQPRKHRSSSHFWFITSLSAWWAPIFVCQQYLL